MTVEENSRAGRGPVRQQAGRAAATTRMPVVDELAERLRDARGFPELLAVCFEAFEVIRKTARGCEDHAPELFAAFMSCADAAVDGREAITAAPSVVRAVRVPISYDGAAAQADMTGVMAGLASLGVLLGDSLDSAAAVATAAGDRTACQEAARAARRITQLMG